MRTNISPVPTGELLELGPEFVVVPAQEGVASADFYRRYAHAPFSCRAHEPTLAIIRTPPLSTPDRVAVSATSWLASVLTVDLDIRRFDGTLFANDPWIALVSVELGPLDPGAYEVVVRSTVLRFQDLRHPETATDPTVTEQHFRFECDEERHV
jgi:hypothetical protein